MDECFKINLANAIGVEKELKKSIKTIDERVDYLNENIEKVKDTISEQIEDKFEQLSFIKLKAMIDHRIEENFFKNTKHDELMTKIDERFDNKKFETEKLSMVMDDLRSIVVEDLVDGEIDMRAERKRMSKENEETTNFEEYLVEAIEKMETKFEKMIKKVEFVEEKIEKLHEMMVEDHGFKWHRDDVNSGVDEDSTSIDESEYVNEKSNSEKTNDECEEVVIEKDTNEESSIEEGVDAKIIDTNLIEQYVKGDWHIEDRLLQFIDTIEATTMMDNENAIDEKSDELTKRDY